MYLWVSSPGWTAGAEIMMYGEENSQFCQGHVRRCQWCRPRGLKRQRRMSFRFVHESESESNTNVWSATKHNLTCEITNISWSSSKEVILKHPCQLSNVEVAADEARFLSDKPWWRLCVDHDMSWDRRTRNTFPGGQHSVFLHIIDIGTVCISIVWRNTGRCPSWRTAISISPRWYGSEFVVMKIELRLNSQF